MVWGRDRAVRISNAHSTLVALTVEGCYDSQESEGSRPLPAPIHVIGAIRRSLGTAWFQVKQLVPTGPGKTDVY